MFKLKLLQNQFRNLHKRSNFSLLKLKQKKPCQRKSLKMMEMINRKLLKLQKLTSTRWLFRGKRTKMTRRLQFNQPKLVNNLNNSRHRPSQIQWHQILTKNRQTWGSNSRIGQVLDLWHRPRNLQLPTCNLRLSKLIQKVLWRNHLLSSAKINRFNKVCNH